MPKKINFQFLISYLGLIPYVLIFLDKYYFLIVEEEVLLNFVIYRCTTIPGKARSSGFAPASAQKPPPSWRRARNPPLSRRLKSGGRRCAQSAGATLVDRSPIPNHPPEG